jgi:hypothetical protein
MNSVYKASLCLCSDQGCQIVIVTRYQNGKKIPNDKQIGIPNGHNICIPNGHKIYQMAITYIYQHLRLQDPPKFTKFGFFGLKIYHLATLVQTLRDVFSQTGCFPLFSRHFTFSKSPADSPVKEPIQYDFTSAYLLSAQGDQMSLRKNRPKCGPTRFLSK